MTDSNITFAISSNDNSIKLYQNGTQKIINNPDKIVYPNSLFLADMDHDGLKDIIEFILVQTQPLSEPSWFGFMITLKDDTKFSRNDISQYLEKNNIQTLITIK